MRSAVQANAAAIAAWLVAALCFALYVRTLAPGLVFPVIDSHELTLNAVRLGVPHPSGYPLYTVSPGRTIAVLARLNSNELASRGRKHVRFDTSDTTCPELWLTVRGNVAGNFAPVGR